jgi:hypothetical protein
MKNQIPSNRRHFMSQCLKITGSIALLGSGLKVMGADTTDFDNYTYCLYTCPQPCSFNPSCKGCKSSTGPVNCTVKNCAIQKSLPTCAHCDELKTCSDSYWANYPGQRTIALSYRKSWGLSPINEVAIDNNAFGIYPVPANEELTISNPDLQRVEYKLYDLSGKDIQGDFIPNSVNTIDISNLAPGNYIIKIFDVRKLLFSSTIIKQ